MPTLNTDEFFDFCRPYSWLQRLGELEDMALPERWTYNVPDPEHKNQKNPILENYIRHTFKRICHLARRNPNEESKWFCISRRNACFNTGLYTQHYSPIYALLYNETKEGDSKKWSFGGFVPEESSKLFDFPSLPQRPKFFDKIDDLLYDTSLKLRVNSSHILGDPKNRARLPMELQNAANLNLLFEGALVFVNKRVEEDYKVAVPQYYEGRVQLLLPMYLRNLYDVDVVLVVSRKDHAYIGHTCLTLDMAYNNARLIAKPETAWIARSISTC